MTLYDVYRYSHPENVVYSVKIRHSAQGVFRTQGELKFEAKRRLIQSPKFIGENNNTMLLFIVQQ